jgi:hypothetical protein
MLKRITPYISLAATFATMIGVASWVTYLFPSEHFYQGREEPSQSPTVFAAVLLSEVVMWTAWKIMSAFATETTVPDHPSKIEILAARIWGRKRLLFAIVATMAVAGTSLWGFATYYEEKTEKQARIHAQLIEDQKVASDKQIDEYLKCAEKFKTTAESAKRCWADAYIVIDDDEHKISETSARFPNIPIVREEAGLRALNPGAPFIDPHGVLRKCNPDAGPVRGQAASPESTKRRSSGGSRDCHTPALSSNSKPHGSGSQRVVDDGSRSMRNRRSG